MKLVCVWVGFVHQEPHSVHARVPGLAQSGAPCGGCALGALRSLACCVQLAATCSACKVLMCIQGLQFVVSAVPVEVLCGVVLVVAMGAGWCRIGCVSGPAAECKFCMHPTPLADGLPRDSISTVLLPLRTWHCSCAVPPVQLQYECKIV